ncbi:MAG: AMP-binding protein [Ilumatobacteraceae bacterium]
MFTPADHLRALAGEASARLDRAADVRRRVAARRRRDERRGAPGEISEICTRFGSVMSGYLDDPVRTAETVRGGWFRAGDMAFMDDDGFLFLAAQERT